MTVFHATTTTINTAIDVVDQADKLAEKVNSYLDVVKRVASDGPKVLKRLADAIQRAIDFVENAISVLRNNPAARGPYRIIVLAVVGILRGVEVALSALKATVNGIRNLFRSQKQKRLEEEIQKLKNKILDYLKISTLLQEVIGYLLAVSIFLEQQQPDIERRFPALKPLVEPTHLRDIDAKLVTLRGILAEINARLDRLTSLTDAFQALLDSVNPIIDLANSVFDAVNSVLAFFRRILQAIKDFIDNIPFVGWLLDQANSLIDRAMEALGISEALRTLGASVQKLPFVSAVASYVRDLANRLDELIKTVTEGVQEFVRQIQEDERVKKVGEIVTALFCGLNIKKLASEYFIPEWVNELLDKSKEIQKLIDQIRAGGPTGEDVLKPVGLKSKLQDLQAGIGGVTTLFNAVPESIFTAQADEQIGAAFAELMMSVREVPAEMEEASLEVVLPFVEKSVVAVREPLERLQKLYADAIQAQETRVTREYLLGGFEVLKEAPKGLGPPDAVMEILQQRVEHP